MTTQILGYMADPTEEERIKRKREEQTKKAIYFARQRLCGIIAIMVGIIAPIISTEGIAASMLLIPYGTIMVLNNNKMITEEDINEEEYHKSTV